MNLLITADLHIKIGQKNVPSVWQKNRYNVLFNKLNSFDCDAICIIGDIFDKLPSLEEVTLYFELITKLNKPCYIFDGNHEAGKRGYTWLEKLEKSTNAINSNVHIINGSIEELPNMDIIPYTQIKTFNPDDYSKRLLLTHVRGSIPPYVIPEIELAKFKRWNLILSGDLHDHSATLEEENAKYNIVYPGSPLSTSFHRNKIKTGVILCDTETLDWEFIELKLPQLLRKTITDTKDAVEDGYDNIIYEISGNIEDLANIEKSDLIDRKVLKSNKESKLALDGMTVEEEVNLYLKEVMEITDTDEILGVLNDYIAKADLE